MKKLEPLSESYYYILLCLSKGANHGYGIMQMTEKLSGGHYWCAVTAQTDYELRFYLR